MREHNFENMPHTTNKEINDKIKQLHSLKTKGMVTDKEVQHGYLVFLQGLDLSAKQVFDVYTNTDFE